MKSIKLGHLYIEQRKQKIVKFLLSQKKVQLQFGIEKNFEINYLYLLLNLKIS